MTWGYHGFAALPRSRCRLQAASKTRFRRGSNDPRPYIWRFTSSMRFTTPSVGPLLHGMVTAANKAARSRVNPTANVRTS